jgi:ribonuclease E
MAKRMLIDAAHPEETRVVVLNGHRLEEFDFETSTKKQIKGNIYLAKVTRVEPSLQAAFVEYGGNRHGFLAFGEIHPDYYRIPVADRMAALEADRAAEAAEDEREELHVESGEAAPVAAPPFEEPPAEEAPDHLAEAAPADVIRESDADAFSASANNDSFIAEPEAEQPGSVELIDTPPAGDSLAAEPPAIAESQSPYEPVPPDGDAFAEDDSIDGAQPGDASDELVAAHAADSAPGIIAPSEDAEVSTAAPQPNHAIETVGGDEIDETTRRRARPYRHYKIQEVVKRRQIMLVQVTKEERGNKGAALTTYISLAGRYCVLMPNTPRGGGVSRKITSMTDRRRLKDLMGDLEVPEGMGVIVRTAGSERSKTEIARDFEYLLRLWDDIRELTLKSTAPALVYEEGNLIKRSIRDLYSRDIDEVLVDGREGYDTAKSFMRMLMPSHATRVRVYNDPSVPLFHRFQVEGQLDAIHSQVVQLRSGGYIVINPTEALVAIDVNSGRSTRERNIEETALKTNLEAAEEVARQLRLRDLAGLVVIDFIDMEEHRNNGAVERRLKEAMRHDRARIQLGRISPFGLLELSRQRLRPSLLEASTQSCPHCNGTGHIRSTESTALHVLRAIEEEGMRRRSAEITVAVPSAVALYILNQKRAALQHTEARYGFHVTVTEDDTLVPPAFRLDRVRALTPAEIAALSVPQPAPAPVEEEEPIIADEALEESIELPGDQPPERHEHRDHGEAMPWAGQSEDAEGEQPWEARGETHETRDEGFNHGDGQVRRRRRRRRRGGERNRDGGAPHPMPDHGEPAGVPGNSAAPLDPTVPAEQVEELLQSDAPGGEFRPNDPHGGEAGEQKRRRRGRRGGRRRRRGHGGDEAAPSFAPDQSHEPIAREVHEQAPAEAAPDTPAPFSTPDFAPAAHTDKRPAPEVPVAQPHVEAEKAPAHAEEERAPTAYNVPPPQEVSGPPANPRRGWWRRR